MATINVLDSVGATVAIEKPLTPGGATAAASRPVTVATDDPLQAKLGIVTEPAPASDTASSGLNGRLQRIAQRVTSLIALVPASLGQKTMAASLAIVIASDQSALAVTPAATESFLGKTGGIIVTPTANFQRPATTPTFVAGQLVANSATAGSVVPLSWATAARVAAGNFYIRRMRLIKSSTTLTNASFRVHFYTASPTFTNGETGVWLTTRSGYLGFMDVTMTQAFSDGSQGFGAPSVGGEINCALASGQTIYACIEARGAYVGVASEVFTGELEIWQN